MRAITAEKPGESLDSTFPGREQPEADAAGLSRPRESRDRQRVTAIFARCQPALRAPLGSGACSATTELIQSHECRTPSGV